MERDAAVGIHIRLLAHRHAHQILSTGTLTPPSNSSLCRFAPAPATCAESAAPCETPRPKNSLPARQPLRSACVSHFRQAVVSLCARTTALPSRRTLLFPGNVVAEFADDAVSQTSQHGGIARKLIGGHLPFKLAQVDPQALMPAAKCLDFRCRIGVPFKGRSEEHTSELQSRQYLVC